MSWVLPRAEASFDGVGDLPAGDGGREWWAYKFGTAAQSVTPMSEDEQRMTRHTVQAPSSVMFLLEGLPVVRHLLVDDVHTGFVVEILRCFMLTFAFRFPFGEERG
jgi:hypothetical protein